MFPDIDNCRECGEIFICQSTGDLCPGCFKKEEQIVFQIRKYVRDHPGQTVTEVSAAMNMKPEVILRLVKQGTLYQRV